MAEAGAAPATSLMIGDTSYDMAMARAAGVTAIGVAWGYHDAEELIARRRAPSSPTIRPTSLELIKAIGMTTAADRRSDVAQPLHPAQPDPHRRHDRRAARRSCSGRATLFAAGRRDRSASRSRWSASSSASAGPKWLAAPLADAARRHEALLQARRRARPAERLEILLDGRPVQDPGARAAGAADARRWPKRSPRNGTPRATRSIRARCR